MIRKVSTPTMAKRSVAIGAMAACILLAGGLAVTAQPTPPSSASLVDGLKMCRAIASEAERVACYDAKVGALIGAVDAGDVRLVDREEVRKTKRQLFGISIPEIDILKSDEKDDEETNGLLETTITSARQIGQASWRFTTIEGAVWEINNAPSRLRPIMAGDKVVFKKASLGYYFVRINGQIGVKGKRAS